MANYNSASTALDTALSSDLVEEYEVGNGKRRVKRGSIKGQIDGLARLEGMAARRASGAFRLGKPQEPSE